MCYFITKVGLQINKGYAVANVNWNGYRIKNGSSYPPSCQLIFIVIPITIIVRRYVVCFLIVSCIAFKVCYRKELWHHILYFCKGWTNSPYAKEDKQSLQKNVIMQSHNSTHIPPKSAYSCGGCIFFKYAGLSPHQLQISAQICGACMIS